MTSVVERTRGKYIVIGMYIIDLNKILETYLVLNEIAHSNVQSTGV